MVSSYRSVRSPVTARMLISPPLPRSGRGSGRGSIRELLPHEPDRPEVPRKPRLDQVRIGQREVALHAPARTPRVADQEPLALVVVPDRHHRVPADRPLTPGRHGRVAAALHRVALEALVNGKTEDEGVARREAPFHLVHVLNQTLV